jgi:hypothetical protein
MDFLLAFTNDGLIGCGPPSPESSTAVAVLLDSNIALDSATLTALLIQLSVMSLDLLSVADISVLTDVTAGVVSRTWRGLMTAGGIFTLNFVQDVGPTVVVRGSLDISLCCCTGRELLWTDFNKVDSAAAGWWFSCGFKIVEDIAADFTFGRTGGGCVVLRDADRTHIVDDGFAAGTEDDWSCAFLFCMDSKNARELAMLGMMPLVSKLLSLGCSEELSGSIDTNDVFVGDCRGWMPEV